MKKYGFLIAPDTTIETGLIDSHLSNNLNNISNEIIQNNLNNIAAVSATNNNNDNDQTCFDDDLIENDDVFIGDDDDEHLPSPSEHSTLLPHED